MLSSLLKEHQAKQAAKKDTRGKIDFQSRIRTKIYRIAFILKEELRKEALTAAGNLTDALVDHLNVG